MSRGTRSQTLELDTKKTDEAVLALLSLGLHDEVRAWKGFDWDAMDRLRFVDLIRKYGIGHNI